MIRITEQYFWHGIFGFFFLSILVVGIIIIDTIAIRPPQAFTWFEILIIILASERLVYFMTFEGTTKIFREHLYDVKKVARTKKVSFEYPTAGPRKVLLDLLFNPWSLGMWMVLLVVFTYSVFPYADLFVLLLALSSVVAVLHTVVQGINHRF